MRKVLFDTTVLLVAMSPTPVPVVVNNQPVTDPKGRVDLLIKNLSANKDKIVIATPALSEALVPSGSQASAYVSRIARSRCFEIRDFDSSCAIEAAIMTNKARSSPLGKKAGATGTWQKVKVDRQIVAIAKVYGVSVIYSNDDDLRALVAGTGIMMVGIESLPLPPPIISASFPLVGIGP